MKKLIIINLIFFIVSNACSENIEFKKDVLNIISGERKISFKIELAISSEERSKGLMHRDKLPLDHGMLFIYPNNQHVTMWMKNTLIPLDMIFIRQNGEIEKIVRMTTPNSLKYISSNNLVKAVLEINGGLSNYLKINKGDKIDYHIFKK